AAVVRLAAIGAVAVALGPGRWPNRTVCVPYLRVAAATFGRLSMASDILWSAGTALGCASQHQRFFRRFRPARTALGCASQDETAVRTNPFGAGHRHSRMATGARCANLL